MELTRTGSTPDRPGTEQFRENVYGPAFWTGTEMVAWVAGLAFNPTSNVWRSIARPPFAVRGDEAIAVLPDGVFVWAGCRPRPCAVESAMYHADTDSWVALPPSPLIAGVRPSAAWTGSEVILWANSGYPGEALAACDPTNNSWRPLQSTPPVGGEYGVTVWNGEWLITHRSSGVVTAIDPRDDEWFYLPDGLVRDRQSAAWANDELVVAGGYASAAPWALTLSR